MDPRGPRIRRKGGHSALPRKIQHRALDDSWVVDVRERGNRQRRLEIREVIGGRHAAGAFARVAQAAAARGVYVDAEAWTIPDGLPGTSRQGTPDGMMRAHRIAERGRGSAS